MTLQKTLLDNEVKKEDWSKEAETIASQKNPRRKETAGYPKVVFRLYDISGTRQTNLKPSLIFKPVRRAKPICKSGAANCRAFGAPKNHNKNCPSLRLMPLSNSHVDLWNDVPKHWTRAIQPPHLPLSPNDTTKPALDRKLKSPVQQTFYHLLRSLYVPSTIHHMTPKTTQGKAADHLARIALDLQAVHTYKPHKMSSKLKAQIAKFGVTPPINVPPYGSFDKKFYPEF
ncbi:hypothetical protein L596_009278 [Steinernema carpocapsae]|uniref:Uncharacterized protein n=1 Tax=Steinernema carpocapsae TaxID=34508 RepID=A0A4U5PEW0_STECR|nr:hypothetical protein L596_009278 [Steinernema carpocapsae]